MNSQAIIWDSEFGKEWTDRTNVNPESRVEGFRRMIGNFDNIESILEIGCNTGYNLRSLSKIKDYELTGIDVQEYALDHARKDNGDIAIFEKGNVLDIPYADDTFDLVFTCGTLMHISPDDMRQAVMELNRVSKTYILVVEYMSLQEEEIHYRGYDQLLWKRFYANNFLQKCLDCGELNQEYHGFNDLYFWLFEKPRMPYGFETIDIINLDHVETVKVNPVVTL